MTEPPLSLDAMAEELARESGLSKVEAYARVLDSDEGRMLAAKHRLGMMV